METRGRIKVLPVGSILDGYLIKAFLRIFFASLLVTTLLYISVDFFDRTSMFIANQTSLWTIIRYLIFNAPLSISRVIGFASLFSALFCLSMAARTHEITAMRSSGISVQRIALPLLIVALFICLSTFIWNEGLVPIFTHQAQTIYQTEIKRSQPQTIFGDHGIWIREPGSFINIEKFDARVNVLEQVTVLLINPDFSLRALVEIPQAYWSGDHWQVKEAIQWSRSANGKLVPERAIPTLALPETPEDLKLLARNPEEFTFSDLQRQVSEMKAKGLDARSYEVDLQIKLALPFISPLMVLVAIPFALKGVSKGGVVLSFGTAMLIAFGYWVLTAFCISLGRSGVVPAWLAAWTPTFIFALIGLYYFTAER